MDRLMIRREDLNATTGVRTVETWDTTTGYTCTVDGVTAEQRALTTSEAEMATARELLEARPAKVSTLAQRARSFLTWVTSRKTVIATDQSNATLTSYVQLGALSPSANLATTNQRTREQDAALKVIIPLLNRMLTAEDADLSFGREATYLLGEVVDELRDLADGELP